MNQSLKLPYANPDLPGCGGSIGHVPSDFQVEEIPVYLPSGSGEHIYLWIEKQGISTPNLRSIICGKLGLAPRQVGHAGLKDANAVTRQWISLHSHSDLPLERLEDRAIKILRVCRHHNRLRPGHLKGNRFQITVRDTAQTDSFATLVERINADGFPNYYGQQRFGADLDNDRRGRALLRTPTKPRMRPEKARFLINAYQSALFNRLVVRRFTEIGNLRQMLVGDLAVFHSSSSFFPVLADEIGDIQRRADAGEIAPSAPLIGYKAPLADGAVGEWERALLREEGLCQSDFRSSSKRFSPKGERRAVRAFPENLAWNALELDGLQCLRFAFTLKSGVYATSFLREVMKSDPARHEALTPSGDRQIGPADDA